MPPLKNNRREKYAQALFKGAYQRDIYIKLYNPSYSMATVDANASRLANNDKVRARIKELQVTSESATIMTVTQRKERLSEIARETVKQPVTAKEVIMSVAELSKLGGDYPVTKIDIDFGKPFRELLDRLQGKRDPAQIEGESE